MKTYVRLLLISAVGSAIITLPNVAIYVALFTGGLGIIFSFLPSVTYYLLAMIPGVALGARTGNRLLGVAFAGVCMALAAFSPVLPDFQRQKDFEAGLINAKITTTFKNPPRTIEIIRPERFKHRLGAISYPEKTCNIICRHLLESGQVDWIRFRIEKEQGGNQIIFFQVEKNEAECKVPGVSPTNIPCALVKQNNRKKADLLIEANFRIGKGESIFKSQTDELFQGWLNYSAISNQVNERKIVYSNVQQSFLSPALPFMLVARFGPSTWESGGIEVKKTSKKLNRLDYKNMLVDLGYKLPSDLDIMPKSKTSSYKNEPSVDQTRALLSVLDLSAKFKFNKPQMEIISDWIFHARQYKEWTQERLNLVKRIYQDTRIGSVSHFNQIATKSQVSPVIIPLVLKQLEDNQYSDQMKQVLQSIRLIDKTTLLENKSTIKDLLETKPNDQFYSRLIFVGARAGIDPAPYISRVEDGFLRSKILAYCYLEPIGNIKSVQVLRTILSKPKSKRNGTRPDDTTDQAFRALARHGDMDTVTQLIKTSEWDHKEALLGRSQYTAKDWRTNLYRACRW